MTLKCNGWPWKTIGHLFYSTSSLCIILKPVVNSNWSYSPEMLNSGQNRRFSARVTLKLDGWPLKAKGHLFYTTSSFVHHFKSIGDFKLGLLSRNGQFVSRWRFFVLCDLEIWRMIYRTDTSPMPHQALRIISLPYVHSNWSYDPETAKLGFDLCDLDLWPLTLTVLHGYHFCQCR